MDDYDKRRIEVVEAIELAMFPIVEAVFCAMVTVVLAIAFVALAIKLAVVETPFPMPVKIVFATPGALLANWLYPSPMAFPVLPIP